VFSLGLSDFTDLLVLVLPPISATVYRDQVRIRASMVYEYRLIYIPALAS
jgi:hypothetical protein